ncbi:hypothetical protein SARC_03671 [Sphaeroforma arctica JP610]|uniref:Syndetin C-terminal domain-containing protein n=1 Tax=Sphaeroforma arctica JP610 TaxID=667725 RepID=A0A0L0G5M2_9EUKA|nr:hypothetical protein SARC_03671 [Sphaeroforma arctica JP610]KNC84106.1 hypothetical protein SARC_03671 [Sphaeroforma arctica JP610]|eukprot:XP_014158008.1 hypothetical protein SARC_03671 [Sphaeroforma arctica JP610]
MEDFQEKLEEPIICATTLNVVRLIGRYMQVLHAIPNAHDDVFAGVAQLVDYYLFAVYQFFGTPLPARGAAPSGGTLYSSSPSSPTPRTTVPANKFETVLGSEGLSRLLIKMRGMVSSGGMHIAPGQLVATPTIAPSVPISNKQELCGLAARVCGLESLKYIANVLNDLKPTFLAICPSTTLVKLHAFYKETVNQIDDLVAYCYRNIATKLMRYDLPLSEMNAMRWDLHDISTEQHKYVDTTIRQCQQFSDRLTQLGYEKIPPVVQEHVWSQVIRVTMFMFIEGFSSARRCSNEGRAMMMLDLKTFVPVLESLTTLRPIPYVKPVELFIKAFYLPEPALEEWLTESTVYTKRQLETFIRHTATVDQFARTRLLAILSAKK